MSSASSPTSTDSSFTSIEGEDVFQFIPRQTTSTSTRRVSILSPASLKEMARRSSNINDFIDDRDEEDMSSEASSASSQISRNSDENSEASSSLTDSSSTDQVGVENSRSGVREINSRLTLHSPLARMPKLSSGGRLSISADDEQLVRSGLVRQSVSPRIAVESSGADIGRKYSDSIRGENSKVLSNMSEVTGKGNLFDSMEGLEIIDDAKSEGEVGISSQEAASVGRRLKKGLRRDSTEEWLGRGSESRRESIHSRGVATLFNREKSDSDLIRTPQVENEENVAEEIDQYGYTIDKKYARLPGGWKVERKKYEELYDYQKEGVKWLYELFQRGKGGILADIMGMGKTIQVCVLLRGLLKGQLASRVLILCEKSLRDTWEKETSQWCGNWHITSLCGYNSASQREKKLKHSWLARNCIVIANQTFIRNDNLPLYSACDENASPMWEESDRVPWDIIVYDEAQRMRNPRTALFQHATIMRAKSKLLLTGTPIQNTPCDLWALMEIAVPGLLGDFAAFKNKFAEVIKRGNRREATELQEKNKDLAVEELNAVIYDYVLRREKYVDEITEGDVSKLEVIVWIGLSEEQLSIYKEYLNTRQVRRACSNNRDGSKGMHVLRCISTLRTLCNHPLFLLPPAEQKWRTAFGISLDALPQNVEKDDLQLSIAKNEDNNDEDDDDDEDVTWIDNDDGAMDNYKHMIRALPQDDGRKIEALSSKLQVLHCLLRRLKENGHRVLLFCPWTSMLDLVQYTILRTDGMTCLRIDGSTPSNDRQRKIRKFQNSKKYFAFVLSTRCGHVGLTLTAADRVVLISPSWNPSDDDQAVARAYRIGQRRDVIAYRLVCSGTIEERIFQREVTKIGDSKVILEDKDQAKYFSEIDLSRLFEYSDPTDLTSKDTLRDTSDTDSRRRMLEKLEEDLGGIDSFMEQCCGMTIDFTDYGQLYKK